MFLLSVLSLLVQRARAVPRWGVAAMPGDIRDKLGDLKYGHYNKHLADVKQFIFIRHGEKVGRFCLRQ